MMADVLVDLLIMDDDVTGAFTVDELFGDLGGSRIGPEDIDGDFSAEMSDLRLP